MFILRVKCLQSSTFDSVALRIHNLEFWNFLFVLACVVYLPGFAEDAIGLVVRKDTVNIGYCDYFSNT